MQSRTSVRRQRETSRKLVGESLTSLRRQCEPDRRLFEIARIVGIRTKSGPSNRVRAHSAPDQSGPSVQGVRACGGRSCRCSPQFPFRNDARRPRAPRASPAARGGLGGLVMTLVTWPEFLRLPERSDTGQRHELHDGEVVLVPPARPLHIKLQKRIEHLLETLAGERGVVTIEFPYRPAPNLQFWFADVAYI